MHDIPYIDLNDLNLDWLLRNMKQVIGEWAAYQASMTNKFDSLAAAYADLQAWINNYFANLNVQDEINNKLSEMARSGELLDIIKPTVIGEADDWLGDHISNPSSPPLDTSLSLANAAAPAKTVGDLAYMLRTPTPDGSDHSLDELTKPGWYTIGLSNAIGGCPDGSTTGSRLVWVNTGAQAGYKYQWFYNHSTGYVAVRLYSSSSWGSWSLIGAPNIKSVMAAAGFILRTPTPEGSGHSLDELTESGWYTIGTNNTIAGCPDESTSGSRLIINYRGAGTGYMYQVFYNHSTGYVAVRLSTSTGFGSWYNPINANVTTEFTRREEGYFIRRTNPDPNTDLDDLTLPGWYVLGANDHFVHEPNTDTGHRMALIFTGSASTFKQMLFFNRRTGFVALRTRTTTGWSAWSVVSDGRNRMLQESVTPRYGKKMFDICHRGLTLAYPENSMPAFKAAKAAGFDWIETDIQYTSDGIAVLQHDPNINGNYCNADGTPIEETTSINSITYDQLLTYDRTFQGVQVEGLKVCTLEDALEEFRKIDMSVFLHFKEYATNDKIPDVIEKVTAAGMMHNVVFATGYQSASRPQFTALAAALQNAMIGYVGQANNCNSGTLSTLLSGQINGNMVWYTTGPWAYDDDTMVDIIDALNAAGINLTARIDGPTEAQNNCRPWAWAFITNGKYNGDVFKPSEYFYQSLMDGYLS